MKLNTFCLIALMLLTGSFLAAYQIDLQAPDYTLQQQNKNVLIQAGEPMLAYYPVNILLPFGMDVAEVQVQLANPVLKHSRMELPMAKNQQPVSFPSVDKTIPNPEVYESDSFWPSKDYDYLGTQMQRGYNIAILNVYPYKYNPISKELFTYTDISITIEGSRNDQLKSQQANMLRSDAKAIGELKQIIVNPENISSYSQSSLWRTHNPQSRLIDLSQPKSMIVITTSHATEWWAEYVAWRNAKGVSTAVYTTNEIYAAYSGEDNAAKVRAFIQDAYQSWSNTATPLEYVILGGDDELVPERGAYGRVGNTVDTRMPTDMYFGNLDGNWNANQNQIYGESNDQVDMLPEVHIGRFPAETAAEFANMFRKTMAYVENDTYSNNISIMFGENLNNNPLTWGGDYKDEVMQCMPSDYEFYTLYQRDGTYGSNEVWHAINNGANAMNHMGHANENILMGQGSGSIGRLENTEYGFLYTQGCYPAAFDQRTSGANSDGESVGEHFVTAAGGVFCFIGNSRYGWYMPGSTDGASQYYDREYFIGLYQDTDTSLGEALTYSRIQNLNAALQWDVMRWCYYEVVLFGDPSIAAKRADHYMPLLSLESYHFSDIDGDNDGSINPGEILRFYPTIKNAVGWGGAENVTVTLSGLPEGTEMVSDSLVIPSLPSGNSSDENLYLSFQLPQSMPYGKFNITVLIDAQHPQTQQSIGLRTFPASFELTLIDNRFPWDCLHSSNSSPIVYDFDSDDQLDILYQDVFGEVYLLQNDAQQFGGFDFDGNHNLMRSGAFGDVNGDGTPDLVFAGRAGEIIASTIEGGIIFNYSSGAPFLYTPVLADLDADGSLEIINVSFDGKVHALDGDGNLLPGFPVQLDSANASEIAAADLDSDGYFKIIVGTIGGKLHVLNHQGNARAGFPVNLGEPIKGAPLVLENNRIAVGAGNKLVLIEPNGEIVFSKNLSGVCNIGAVAGDFNLDGINDLVFTTINGMLYLIDQQGNDFSGFPVDVGASFTSPPLIADLSGDNYPDILLQNYMSSVYAFDRQGSVLPGFPFQTLYNGNTPGTLVDLDGDGWMKLVCGYSTGVVVINLRLPMRDKMPWKVYRGSLLRQGSVASTGYVSNSEDTIPPAKTILQQNYPNPFNPSTTISFSLAKRERVALSIYNLKGQLVNKLLAQELDAGEHSLVFDGKDSAGRSLASGMYFYRLQTSEGSLTKRMLLIK
ncbi:MAG TPA: C25 family cysteine peptidase [Candidatus Cloacimonadota bacterium]|nr:C25 family cysteine peptidase [Candidatus Cloacimonadota bacterium]